MVGSFDGRDTFAKAVGDLALGLPIVLHDAERAIYALSAECAQGKWVSKFTSRKGTVVVLTRRRATTLKARTYDGSIARIAVPEEASHDWVRSVVDPSFDLRHPLKGPLLSQRDGSSHLHRTALEMLKRGRMLPAVLSCACHEDNAQVRLAGNTVISNDDANAVLKEPAKAHSVIHARLPLKDATNSIIHVFRSSQGVEEHCAIEVGSPNRSRPVLARLHSSCFTGDIFGSLKCDCGTQLARSVSAMAAEAGGVLLYMNQEGRGIGLVNKVRAYALQDQGYDTVESNHRLGFEDDERDFRLAADMLRQLGFMKIRLMTNNPSKVDAIGSEGIEVVERVPIPGWKNPHNAAYIDTKIGKSGHL
ncbi:MAG: GTP cyclohydrolase II [Rhodobacteraceae bacterium]|nr:GTP cyclohydrolase II [Paracoccaceae bacterium]